MKIIVFGSSGRIGRVITEEALRRGHYVTAVSRRAHRMGLTHPRLTSLRGDAADAASVAAVAKGHDVAVVAVGPAPGGDDAVFAAVARAMLEGLPKAEVRRVVILGGAGSLEVAPGVRLVDTPEFPVGWKSNALGQAAALELYRLADCDWTYISPPALIEPGERTGHYRSGGDQLLIDGQGKSRITIADYAIALVDQVERGDHLRQRMTVAY
jgi:hypothetical protein